MYHTTLFSFESSQNITPCDVILMVENNVTEFFWVKIGRFQLKQHFKQLISTLQKLAGWFGTWDTHCTKQIVRQDYTNSKPN